MITRLLFSTFVLAIVGLWNKGGGVDALALHLPEIHGSLTSAAPHAAVAHHSGVAFLSQIKTSYMTSLEVHPLYTKMATGGLLATCGDAIAQTQGPMKKDGEPYDKRRALSFMMFDMVYRALQHVAFPVIVHECHGQYFSKAVNALPVLSHSLSIPTDYLAAMEQTLASQLGIVPFMYYPVFFALTGFLQGLTTPEAVDRAKETFLPLMKRNLLFWIPVQFVQFGFIDEELQIPFLCAAGLCWTFILSAFAGSAKKFSSPPSLPTQEEQEAAAAATSTASRQIRTVKSRVAVET